MSSGAFFAYTKKVQVKHEFLVDAQKNSKNYMRYQFAALIILASKRYTVFNTCYL